LSMFYAQFVLSKKGPLAKIWLAAHWEKKLSKAQVYETNVSEAVDEILKPKVKMALRTTGHLLLGIVRIYSRRAIYLLEDCENASLKINLNFNTTGKSKGALRDTSDPDIPDVLGDFDATLPDNFELPAVPAPVNQSRIEDITLREDRAGAADNNDFDNDLGMDDFGGAQFDDDLNDFDIEHGRRAASEFSRASVERLDLNRTSLASDKAGNGAPHVNNEFMDNDFDNDFNNDFGDANEMDQDLYGDAIANNDKQPAANNDIGDSFHLEPLEVASVTTERAAPRTRKRKRLLIDEIKNISGEEMKANMSSFDDILQQPDLAPPTRKLMHLREHGVTEKLFAMPGCQAVTNTDLIRIYQSHLVPHARTLDESAVEEIRRDLNLTDHIDFDFDAHFDDFDPIDLNSDLRLPTPPVAQVFDTIEEVDENVQPDQADLTVASEKRPRKSRQEKEKAPAAEESGDEEEDEQRYSKRTRGIAATIASKLKTHESITLNDLLSKRSTRKTAAQSFYALLELAKWQAIELSQDEPYGEITIMEGPEMEAVLAGN
jgi:cohesin complex subunit SCC1